MNVHLSAPNADGSRTGYLANVEDVPRIGEEVLLLDGEGETRRFRVKDVRHIIEKGHDYRASSQQIEVTLARLDEVERTADSMERSG